MYKRILLFLFGFCLVSCFPKSSQRKPRISFFLTADFNKEILPEFTIADLMRALEQEGLQKNRDFYYSYSHAPADPISADNVAEFAVKEIDLIVTLGDQASNAVAKLSKGQKFKVFMVARSIPKSFESQLMTGVFVKNKVSSTELEDTLIKRLIELIRTGDVQNLPAIHF